MSYDAYENTSYLGDPIELYLFRYASGGAQWALTSSESPVLITALGLSFEPEAISRSEVSQGLGESPNYTTEIKLPNTSPVAKLFKGYLPQSQVLVTCWRMHREDTAQERRVVFTGEIGSCVFDDGDKMATLRGVAITEAMRRVIPIQIYQTQCNWSLFGPGCGLNKEAYRQDDEVLAQTGAVLSSAVLGGEADGYFTNGWVERLNGETRFILNHVGNDATLSAPFSAAVVGETVKFYPGCMRTEDDCSGRYGNLPQYLGWPRIPNYNPFELNAFNRG